VHHFRKIFETAFRTQVTQIERRIKSDKARAGMRFRSGFICVNQRDLRQMIFCEALGALPLPDRRQSPSLENETAIMDCRPGCGACCIAPSISSLNKPAGVPCTHLAADLRCTIFGRPERPACCAGLQPSPEMCGESRAHALHWLADLEALTRPG